MRPEAQMSLYDSPFVSKVVCEARFAEKFVELFSVSGNAGADVRDAVFDVVLPPSFSCRRAPDRTNERVRVLERSGLGDVEPVEEPVPHQVEVRRYRRAGFAVDRSKLV